MYSNQLPKTRILQELFMTRPTTYFKRSALFAMLVACGAAAQAADKLTVQLDWLPGGDKSFVYAGVQQGFSRTKAWT
jgi:ABC-type nitrate/sulfonate/bicarbonate transport system substrate-binding protein